MLFFAFSALQFKRKHLSVEKRNDNYRLKIVSILIWKSDKKKILSHRWGPADRGCLARGPGPVWGSEWHSRGLWTWYIVGPRVCFQGCSPSCGLVKMHHPSVVRQEENHVYEELSSGWHGPCQVSFVQEKPGAFLHESEPIEPLALLLRPGALPFSLTQLQLLQVFQSI